MSSRDNSVFNRALIDLQRVGNATNVVITLQADSLGPVPGVPFVLMNTVLPNMLPYENRVQFGGRTGGQNLTLDLDNVNVTYANPFDINTLPFVGQTVGGNPPYFNQVTVRNPQFPRPSLAPSQELSLGVPS